ncbi:MAG TPA: DUF378 domain-containing protein [Acidobacteria bacterium]|nr:DUF378 domain-containing protein [Acidobacteriota bacterium]
MGKLSTLDRVCLILVIIGGLNWLLVGLFEFDLVAGIFGAMATRIVYILVGLATLYVLFLLVPKIGKKAKA